MNSNTSHVQHCKIQENDSQNMKEDFIQAMTEENKQRYDLSPQPIGQGFYGKVYQAKLKVPPYTQRVIKIIEKKRLKDPNSTRKEVDILKRLNHPNIVRLYQCWEDSLAYYLVLDLWNGGELLDLIEEKGALPENEAKRLFRQMLAMVNYLHENKISHRDFKPQNLLFNKKGGDTLGLVDFGLAFRWEQCMSQELKKKEQNKMVGTAYYVAPEVVSKDYDERCDIWSLGVVLYMLATATPPFQGKDDLQVLKSIYNLQMAQGKEFKKLSHHLKHLLTTIFVPKEKRPSIKQIMMHTWLMPEGYTKPKLNYSIFNRFANYSKLKRLTLYFMARQLPAIETQKLGEQFSLVDTNNDGVLTAQEIGQALVFQEVKPTELQLKKVLRRVNMKKNGKIAYDEFLACSLEQKYCSQQQYLKYIFSVFNSYKEGPISLEELQKLLSRMGLKVPQRLGKSIMRQADHDKDGLIKYEEFLNNMQKGECYTSSEEKQEDLK